MDDTSLNEIISALPEKCIALMEDIDAAFLSSVTRENESQEKSPVDKKHSEAGGKGPPESNSRITLSGLLNALDGVGAQEGRLLFATTNKYSALDPALCRPGRMDLHIEFKLASKYQADELFKCFYLPSDDFSATPSDAVDDGDAETESIDSGYSSVAEKVAEPPSTTLSATDAPACIGSTHSARVPVLTRGQVTHLAKKFADTIPEREFSMASLQGYLMGYKTRPFDAVKEASRWVEKERSEQLRKQKADSSSPALTSTITSEKDGIPDTKEVTPAP
jgi:chaperone BCS1